MKTSTRTITTVDTQYRKLWLVQHIECFHFYSHLTFMTSWFSTQTVCSNVSTTQDVKNHLALFLSMYWPTVDVWPIVFLLILFIFLHALCNTVIYIQVHTFTKWMISGHLTFLGSWWVPAGCEGAGQVCEAAVSCGRCWGCYSGLPEVTPDPHAPYESPGSHLAGNWSYPLATLSAATVCCS